MNNTPQKRTGAATSAATLHDGRDYGPAKQTALFTLPSPKTRAASSITNEENQDKHIPRHVESPSMLGAVLQAFEPVVVRD